MGQAPDKGLYFPESLPLLSTTFIQNLKHLSKEEIGVEVMRPYVLGSLPDAELERIVAETINFPFPLESIHDGIYALELFHGPTYAFKDVGARFMSRCLGYFNRNKQQHTTVLVATSGDTGGAVANGFLGVEGVDVVILYPSGKVSKVQELQLTTCGKNITALEIDGTFDDCQAMVKLAFTDADLNKQLTLTSANSINVARWLPQQLYYFFALQQWPEKEAPVISVPSGNFGNICAGILAHISGLPVRHFIAACNANDVVPRFFDHGKYQPQPSVATISNAMDVGNPSNFIRILQIFENNIPKLKEKVSSVTVTDEATRQTMAAVHTEYGYTLDPHGAVAYTALDRYIEQTNTKGFILETAHPVKFPEVVEEITGKTVSLPDGAESLLEQNKQSIAMEASFDQLKAWLMSR